MLMVIFGAGASFDSSPTYTLGMAPPGASQIDRDNDYHRLPLAKDLFANRPLFIEAINAFPQCKTIVSRLRDPAITSGQGSIEARLQEIEEEAKTYSRGRQELAAVRCYLQVAITQCESRWRNVTGGITNHLSLLREIERLNKTEEPVCLVTINYDTLLEGALADLGLEIKEMDDYTRRPILFRLFKLHGSVDWGRRVKVAFPASLNTADSHAVLKYLVEHGTEGDVTSYFARCDSSTMIPPGEPHALFPAIAIPVEKKNVFECPQAMLEDLVALLPQVRKILVIGWRATEKNFLDMLRNRLTGLKPGVHVYIVVGPRTLKGERPGEAVQANIFGALLNNRPSSCYIDDCGFTDFIRSPHVQEFLAS